MKVGMLETAWESTTWFNASNVPRLFPDAFTSTIFVASCVALTLFYAMAVSVRGYSSRGKAPVELSKEEARKWYSQRAKLRSWILTGISALVMTVGAVPFLLDLAMAKGDVAMVQKRPVLSTTLTTFFVAYLCMDLTIGSLQYRRQITLLTGWIHHTAYTALLLHVIRRGFCHVFAMAAIMELPTFVLALAMLYPKTRNDVVFASLFFTTRLLLHAILVALYITPYGRLYGTSMVDLSGAPIASWVPAGALLAAAPLHIMWFTGSVKGILKRRRQARAATKADVERARASNKAEKTTLPQRPKLVSMASSYLASSRPIVMKLAAGRRAPAEIILRGRARRQRMRQAIDHEVRTFFAKPKAVWARSAGEADGDLDVLRGIGSSRSLTKLRLRTGQTTAQVKSIGGQVRRGLVGF